MNVGTTCKKLEILFYKASVLYIIKNELTFQIEQGHNTRQLSNINVPTICTQN